MLFLFFFRLVGVNGMEDCSGESCGGGKWDGAFWASYGIVTLC